MAAAAVMPQFASLTDAERAAFICGIESDGPAIVAGYRDGDGFKFPIPANAATATAGRSALSDRFGSFSLRRVGLT